ncbi:MAG: transposase, partial [Phototrophicales bacterium]
TSTGKIGGFDFGIQTFLTNDEGLSIESSRFFRQLGRKIAKLNRSLSRKQQGSNNYHKAKRALARAHQRIADKRKDYFFKLAHQLCDEYNVLCFEDLNIKAMQIMWGRIVADYAFTTFLEIVQYVALQRSKQVVLID